MCDSCVYTDLKPLVKAPVSMPSLRADANEAFRSGNYGAAEDLYSKAILQCEEQLCATDLHTLYSNRAAARLKEENFAGALQDAQASLAISPG